MDVIPVIDVKHGQVVRALRGDRASYRPIETPFAAGSDPVAVALGLRALFAFPVLYVADLDGIEGRGSNPDLAARLAEAIPDIELWIDAGQTPSSIGVTSGARSAFTPVVGTEVLKDESDVAGLRALAPESFVLSLDFKGDEFNGPCDVLEESDLWPERVIVMTLAKVGSNEGPDLQCVTSIVERAGPRRVYAAGGVRDAADIAALASAGAAGVLIASALHDKKITAGDLNKIAGR